MSEIKVLALDFGNVLGTFDHMKACGLLVASCHANVSPEQVFGLYFGNEHEKDRVIGDLPSYSFFRDVLKELRLREWVTFQNFATMWGDIFTSAPEEVVHLLNRVRSDVRLLLVSNTEALHWRYMRDLPTVAPFFPPAQQALSFRLRARKPDRQYYERALATVGACSSEVLYIDDIRLYVDVFRGMGGNAERFDLTEDQPHKLADILEQYKLLT